jgi:flagellar motility protein MotE (MotC chaperone)
VKSIPRILPLVGVAIGGVLAINALSGARDLPNLVSGAKAWAEEAAKPVKDRAGKGEAAKAAATGDASDTAASGPLPPPSIKPPPVCAPTAAELAKEAGLSPAELQVLQNLGERRTELDQRETTLNTQLALLAAAEAKLDAKAKALQGLKGDIQGLLNDANGRESAEVDRLVKVFEGMKPKDAAPRMVLLDDAVRLPIAAKMKERALSAILANMPPAEAKKLTESLAKRFSAAQTLAQNGIAQADPATAAPVSASAKPAKAAASAPAKKPAASARQGRKARPRKRAPAAAQASAGKPDAAAPAPAAGAAAAQPPTAG